MAQGIGNGVSGDGGGTVTTPTVQGVDDAIRFLRLILPDRREDETYRIEVFPTPKALSKNWLDIEKMAAELVRQGQSANCYVALFTFPIGGRDRRAAHAIRCRVAWADIDFGPTKAFQTLEEAVAAVKSFALAPACIVSTGRGLHVYWLLREPAEGHEADRLSRIVAGIAQRLHGDHVQDKARILRCPGTLNVDPGQRKDGKTYRVQLLQIDPDAPRYALDEFVAVGIPDMPEPERRTAQPVGDVIPQGRRNNALTSLAGTMRGRGMGEEAIIAAIIAENITRCDPPLPEDEVRTIARSVMRYTPGTQGAKHRIPPPKTHAPVNECDLETEADPARFFPQTDAGNAELFAQLFRNRLRFDWLRDRWLIFGPHHWHTDRDGALLRYAKQAVRERLRRSAEIENATEREKEAKFALSSENRSRLEAMVIYARAEIGITDAGKNWDVDPSLLGVANGVVDLRTGTLCDGRPEDRISMSTEIEYDPNARCPRFLRFLDEIFEGNVELIAYIARRFGYDLTAETSEQTFEFDYGNGANGKTVLVNIKRHIAGEYGLNLPFSTLEMGDRSSLTPDLALLPGKRVVTASETSAEKRLNTARIKALTGGDEITANPKYHPLFQFRPVAKFTLVANYLPVVTDNGDAFWRRVHVVPFTRQFTGAQIDKNLERKLKAEASGILAWAVRGAIEWYEKGLMPPPIVLLTASEWRATADELADFIHDECDLGPELVVRAGELWERYRGWADRLDLAPDERLGARTFGSKMAAQFDRHDDRYGRFYRGIGLPPTGPMDSPDGGFEWLDLTSTTSDAQSHNDATADGAEGRSDSGGGSNPDFDFFSPNVSRVETNVCDPPHPPQPSTEDGSCDLDLTDAPPEQGDNIDSYGQDEYQRVLREIERELGE